MSNVRELHHEAMNLTETALEFRRKGDTEQSTLYFHRAFELESQAANLLENKLANEPTRSILYRSAATLALDCGEIREAERLVAKALLGNPPEEIVEELYDVLAKLRV